MFDVGLNGESNRQQKCTKVSRKSNSVLLLNMRSISSLLAAIKPETTVNRSKLWLCKPGKTYKCREEPQCISHSWNVIDSTPSYSFWAEG